MEDSRRYIYQPATNTMNIEKGKRRRRRRRKIKDTPQGSALTTCPIQPANSRQVNSLSPLGGTLLRGTAGYFFTPASNNMDKLSLLVITPVKNSDDVFNHVVEVQRLDTKETGTLLCSHCCRWPQHLINKAKWLEGCYTPASYKNDSRLLMGYHPHSITRWEYEETDDGSVFVHLTVDNYHYEGDDDRPIIEIDGQMPLPPSDIRNPVNPGMVGTRTHRLISRMWREIRRSREASEAVLVFFRTAYSIVDQGMVSDLAVASCIPAVEELHQELVHLGQNSHLDFNRRAPLSEDPVEVYNDGVKVVNDNAAKGYLEAVTPIEVGITRSDGREVVIQQVTNEAVVWGVVGYAKSVSINLYERREERSVVRARTKFFGWFVNADAPEMGYMRAVHLNSFKAYKGDEGWHVSVGDATQGYWPAQEI